MDADRARLTWACRRGMLELDLLLEGFMERGYDALSAADRATFERLLETGDQQLLGWLMGNEEPDEKEFIPVIAAIRAST
jgi:antitoxin CptB